MPKVPCNLDHKQPNFHHPAVNFINVLLANFTYKSLFGSFFYLHLTREKLLKRHWHKKFAKKMLMKLTPEFAGVILILHWQMKLTRPQFWHRISTNAILKKAYFFNQSYSI